MEDTVENTQTLSQTFESKMREIMNQAPQCVVNAIPEPVIMTYVDHYGGLQSEQAFDRMVSEWNRTVRLYSRQVFSARRAELAEKVNSLWADALKAAVAMAKQYGQVEFDRNFREQFARADAAITSTLRERDDECACESFELGIPVLTDLVFAVDNYFIPLGNDEKRRVKKPGSAAKRSDGPRAPKAQEGKKNGNKKGK